MTEERIELEYESTAALDKQAGQAALPLFLCALFSMVLGVGSIFAMLFAACGPDGPSAGRLAALVGGVGVVTCMLGFFFWWLRKRTLARSRLAVTVGRVAAMGFCAFFAVEGAGMMMGILSDTPKRQELPGVGLAACVIVVGLLLFVVTAWKLGTLRELLRSAR